MLQVRLKFHPGTLWLVAAVALSMMEIYAAGGRVRLQLPAAPRDSIPGFAREIGLIRRTSDSNGAAILVLENLASASNSGAEVTITARLTSQPAIGSVGADELPSLFCPNGGCARNPIPAPARQLPVPLPLAARQNVRVNHDHETLKNPRSPSCERPGACTSDSESISALIQDSADKPRIYFLQTAIRTPGVEAGHAAISCRPVAENGRVRIYVDEHVRRNESLQQLVQAIHDASSSELGEIVQTLVGPVRDIDHDGRLTIVVTPEIARLGTGASPVHGLTRPADFLPGLERPEGNNSDVIFLSSELRPGDQLRAVLAHEWCHASVFSRRMQLGRRADEDWLNEAIAHVVEVRASGSHSNLSHRIQKYRSSPSQSPLVVADYYRPDFWRHDGCRGAAFLFLNWCLEHADERLLDRLVNSECRGTESLEMSMGRPFADLFHAWSVSQAHALACQTGGSDGSAVSAQVWRISGDKATLKLRISGTSAAYVRIESANPEWTWRLTASSDQDEQLRATLIPVK